MDVRRTVVVPMVVGAVAVAMSLALSACSGHRSATPPAVTAGETALATATASPAPGIPQRHLTLAPDVPFPPGLSVVIGWAGYRHGGGGLWAVKRYTATSSGVRVDDLLPAATGTPAGGLLGMTATPDGALWAGICTGPGCGSEGSGDPGDRTTFRESTDGGITWTDRSQRTGRWWIRGAARGEVFAVSFDGPALRYSLEPSGTPLVPPVPDGYSPLTFKDDLFWVDSTTGELLGETGVHYGGLPAALPPGFVAESVTHAGTNLASGGYLPPSPKGVSGPTPVFLFVARPGTAEPETYFTYGPDVLTALRWLDATHILVIADYQRVCKASNVTTPLGGSSLAIVDIDAQTLAFIGSPLLVDGCGTGGAVVIESAQGDFAFVHHVVGDCLYIRTTPSVFAPNVGCMPEGQMVRTTGPAQEGEGRSWLPVETFGGRAGFAAAEFLER